MKTIDKNKITRLIKEGYSGSAIAKELHIRKQTALELIRDIQKRPKNVKKITNPSGRIGKSVEIDYPSQSFIDQLYREGYSESFIKRLVNTKHPETSKYKISKYLTQLKQNPEMVKTHKASQKAVREMGKDYKRNREEGKYYRETEDYYLHPVNWALYR